MVVSEGLQDTLHPSQEGVHANRRQLGARERIEGSAFLSKLHLPSWQWDHCIVRACHGAVMQSQQEDI